MSFDTTYGIQRLFERIGLRQGGRYPQFGNLVIPTVNVADLSASTSDLLEPRGMVGVVLTPAAGEFPMVELNARAGGGCIIESLAFQLSQKDTVRFTRGGASLHVFGGVTTDLPILPIGSVDEPIRSLARSEIATIPFPVGANTIELDSGSAAFVNQLNPNTRIWVPPGSWFSIAGVTANTDMSFNMSWREIADLPGA